MSSKTIYLTIAGAILTGTLILTSCGSNESDSSTKRKQTQCSALERMLQEVPKDSGSNEPHETVDGLVSDCESLIKYLSGELEELKETNKRLSSYTRNLRSIRELFQKKGLVTKAKTECNTLIDKIDAENKTRYLEIKKRYPDIEMDARNLLIEINKAEGKVSKEVETVSGFLQRFEEIKDLVAQKSYYAANNNTSSLLSDIEKYTLKYDPELVFRANRNNTLKGYHGKQSFLSSLLRYKNTKLHPEISKMDDIIRQFNTLCYNYDSHVQNKNIDKLLKYDTLLQKMDVIVSKKPYLDNNKLCEQVKEKQEQVYTTLKSLARAKFNSYKSKIKELGQKIESTNILEAEMNRIVKELESYKRLLKKYEYNLFSDRYLK